MTFAISRSIGPVKVDVVVRESHTSQLQITKNPVEAGADVSDHAFVLPKLVTLEPVAGSKPGGIGPAASAWSALIALQETRQPFTLVTALRVYPNMLIEKMIAERDKMTGRVLSFRADLEEVIIVDTQTTAGSGGGTTQSGLQKGNLPAGAPEQRGSPPVSSGTTPSTPVPAGSEPSILKRLTG